MRKYANKIEETNVYRVLYIPRLDSLSNPRYGIPFYVVRTIYIIISICTFLVTSPQ
jgi:hypothetical protein